MTKGNESDGDRSCGDDDVLRSFCNEVRVFVWWNSGIAADGKWMFVVAHFASYVLSLASGPGDCRPTGSLPLVPRFPPLENGAPCKSEELDQRSL